MLSCGWFSGFPPGNYVLASDFDIFHHVISLCSSLNNSYISYIVSICWVKLCLCSFFLNSDVLFQKKTDFSHFIRRCQMCKRDCPTLQYTTVCNPAPISQEKDGFTLLYLQYRKWTKCHQHLYHLLKYKTTILHLWEVHLNTGRESNACPILIITAEVPLSRAISHQCSSGAALYPADCMNV